MPCKEARTRSMLVTDAASTPPNLLENTMQETKEPKWFKDRVFFDQPASLVIGEYKDYVVPYNLATQAATHKRRAEAIRKRP